MATDSAPGARTAEDGRACAVDQSDSEDPDAAVDLRVMCPAEQDHLVHVGASAFGERRQVMDIAPRRGSSAQWEGAADVAQGECEALRGRREADPAAQIEHLARSAHEQTPQVAIARELIEHAPWHWTYSHHLGTYTARPFRLIVSCCMAVRSVARVGRFMAPLRERLDVDHQQQLRGRPMRLWPIDGALSFVARTIGLILGLGCGAGGWSGSLDGAKLNERVGAPLVGGPVVVWAEGKRKRIERVAHELPGNRVQHALQMQHAVERAVPGQPTALKSLTERAFAQLRCDGLAGSVGQHAQVIGTEARGLVSQVLLDLRTPIERQITNVSVDHPGLLQSDGACRHALPCRRQLVAQRPREPYRTGCGRIAHPRRRTKPSPRADAVMRGDGATSVCNREAAQHFRLHAIGGRLQRMDFREQCLVWLRVRVLSSQA